MWVGLLIQEITNFKNLKENIKKIATVNRYRQNISEKIKEANSVVADQIIPQLDIIANIINQNIGSLIQEITILQEEAAEEKNKLIRKKKELESMIIMNYILLALKSFGRIAKCFGVVGQIVGTLADVGGQLGDSLILKSDSVRSDIQSISNIAMSRSNNLPDSIKIISDTALNSRKRHKYDQTSIEAIDDAIKQADRNIQSLTQHEEEIYNFLIPLLTKMESDISEVASQLNSKSKVTLQISKWQVQIVLKDMKLHLRRFTKGFYVEEDLNSCIENLEEVMTTLIKVYDQIQDYQYQKELADYIADINLSVDYADPEVWKAANELEISIRSDLVLQHYRTAIDALKQTTFPLVYLYLEQPLLPPHLMLQDDFENFVNQAMEKVEVVTRKIKEYRSSIIKHDKYINSGWFNSDYKSSEPFFVWKNERHRKMILELLSGKKVVVMADILIANSDKEAIKFNKIDINFRSNDRNVSAEIKNKLEGFKVNATHLGNSYYRFKNSIYIITTSSQNFVYSFERDVQGNPVHKNNVYDKIISGDLMLSPYAMWEFQIINSKSKSPFQLQMYADKVDLELTGYGYYFSKGHDISVTDVKRYYEEDEDLSAIACIDQQK